MTDAAVVGRLRRAYPQRAIEPAAVRRVRGSGRGPAVSYRFTPLDGAALDVRACRADAPVPVQFRGPFFATALDCLMSRAATDSAARRLRPAEHDLLLAIRFATAYAGAIHLEQALLEGAAGESMTARLARLRNRIEASEAVSRLASPHLAGGPEPVR